MNKAREVKDARIDYREKQYQTIGIRMQTTLPKNRYFVKKGFCIVTHKIPSSEKLNKINIWLKKSVDHGYLFSKFENYINHLLFSIPLPMRDFPASVKLYLPNQGSSPDEVIEFS